MEPGFLLNVDKQLDGKLAIAAQALALIQPGMTVALTGGTTTYQLAVLLAPSWTRLRNLTVVTNSLKVAELLYRQQGSSDLKVIVTGGERTPSEALVGPVARLALGSLNTDLCFMGVHGLDSEPRPDAAPTRWRPRRTRRSSTATSRLVILADSTKFQVRSLAAIAPLGAVDTIITDDVRQPRHREQFAPLVQHFIKAPSAAASRAAATLHQEDLMTIATTTLLADGRELIYFDDGGRPRPTSAATPARWTPAPRRTPASCALTP